MAIRLDAVGEELNRTANLPSNTAFTYMIWSVLDSDQGTTTFQPYLFALTGDFLQGYACGLYGDLFRIEVYEGGVAVRNGVASGRPTLGTPHCMFLRCSGTGTNLLTGGYREAGQNAFTTAQATMGAISAPATAYFGGIAGAFFQNGRKWNIKVWNRALSDAEILIESFHGRPQFPGSLNFWWPLPNASDTADRSGNGRNATVVGSPTTGDTIAGLWRPRQKIILPRGLSAVTVNVSVTDEADALSGTAGVQVGVTHSSSDASDTLSATATLPVSVSLSATDAGDTVSSTAGVRVEAGLAVTDEADTLAATVVVGDAAIEVNLGVTDTADTLSATAALTVSVALSTTDAADSLSATSTMPVTVNASATDSSDALASTAGVVVGVDLAVTDAADTLAATAIVQQEGVVSVTLDVVDEPDTLQAEAVLGPAPQPSGSGGRNWLIDIPVDRRDVVVNVTDDDDTLQATATVQWSAEKVRRLMAAQVKRTAKQAPQVVVSVVDEDDMLLSMAAVRWPDVGLVRSVALTRGAG